MFFHCLSSGILKASSYASLPKRFSVPSYFKISYWQFDADEREVKGLFSEKLMTVTASKIPVGMNNLRDQLVGVKVAKAFTPSQGILHNGESFIGVSYRSPTDSNIEKYFSRITKRTAGWVKLCMSSRKKHKVQNLDEFCHPKTNAANHLKRKRFDLWFSPGVNLNNCFVNKQYYKRYSNKHFKRKLDVRLLIN